MELSNKYFKEKDLLAVAYDKATGVFVFFFLERKTQIQDGILKDLHTFGASRNELYDALKPRDSILKSEEEY